MKSARKSSPLSFAAGIASTIAMIDRMIARENEGRGREQMTIGFHDGRFYRNEVTDEGRDRQIAGLCRAAIRVTVERQSG